VIVLRIDYLKNLGLITQVGLLMAIPIFLCVFGGIWLDERFGTSPLFLIIFIILGVLSAFRNMYKIIMAQVDTTKKGRR